MTGQFLDCLHGLGPSIHRVQGVPRGGGGVARVEKLREAALMAKAELARKAGVSESTIDRVESGHPCRMETKRRILFALGLSLQESGKLWPRINGRARRQ